MGFFDSKWIVEFEVSKGILSSNKKGSMVVEASSEYSAKDKAKAALRVEYSYVKILSARKSGGRSEENKVTYAPKTTIVTHQSASQSRPSRQFSPQEREAYREQARKNEEARIQKEKFSIVKKKATQCQRAEKFYIRSTILTGIISLAAFLFGWIPHWIGLVKTNITKLQLAEWIDLGHSETDKYGQEMVEDIAKYTKEANSVIWIPFVILGIGIAVTIFVFFLTRKKTPGKMEKAKKELDSSLKEYEEIYGKLNLD